MANFDLDFHPIRQYFIPFIQAGIGGARTEVSYNSAPISPVIVQISRFLTKQVGIFLIK